MRGNRGTIITILVVTVLLLALIYLLGPWWALGIVGGILLVVALLLLLAAKTGPGRRVAEKVGKRVGRTRVGHRMARAQLRAEAKRKGVATTDPFGRPLSDVELQLELVDTPETRQIKRQLKAMNPQQRAQALRMLESQAEQTRLTGEAPPQVEMRQPGVSGRPVTRPPRSRSKKRRR
jgi:hypothetical protein